MREYPLNNQEKLDEVYEIVKRMEAHHEALDDDIEDMHSTLNWLRRRERIRMILATFYWIFIIGIVFGAYYYIEPILNYTMSQFGLSDILKSFENGVSGLPDLKNIKNVLQAAASSTNK